MSGERSGIWPTPRGELERVDQLSQVESGQRIWVLAVDASHRSRSSAARRQRQPHRLTALRTEVAG